MFSCEHVECGRCDSTGWVCENCDRKPWDGNSSRDDACGCGAGMPCPTCNVVSPGEFPRLSPDSEIICSVLDG